MSYSKKEKLLGCRVNSSQEDGRTTLWKREKDKERKKERKNKLGILLVCITYKFTERQESLQGQLLDGKKTAVMKRLYMSSLDVSGMVATCL